MASQAGTEHAGAAGMEEPKHKATKGKPAGYLAWIFHCICCAEAQTHMLYYYEITE